ncbi:MAG: hypothetical protein LBD61_01655, partial [Endomicrobium sp.]|nr:hypothetical protein [Endomicrobium sp.]
KGKVEIESKEGEGTEFILTFPKSEKPIWFADKIELKKGDIVVILDDDESVHELWKEKFRRYEKEIPLKYFTDGKETVEYLKTLGKKEKVFLLTDYKLKNQNINGIDVIEKSGMEERSILFTGEYLSAIDSFNEKAKFLIMFHKTNIVDIPLEIKSCS